MTDPLADLRKLKLPFDVDKVDPQCHECVRAQLKKYDKYVNPETGDTATGKFMVPCKGVLADPIDPSYRAMLGDDAWEDMLAINDKVLWAAKYLKDENDEPWTARWYQVNILRCTARRKVLRLARRIGKTTLVCVEILHDIFTNKNRRICVVGPQKIHAEEIMTRIRAFIQRSPELSDMVIRDVSGNVSEIKLSNESRIRGFAGGTKGGNQGVGVRGQDADFLYLEEMTFIDEEAIVGAVLPILMTNPETGLVGFSTPNNFKTQFRKICEDNPHYKEYHYDYTVLPHYKSVEMERAQYTQEKWECEQLAIFGSTESGVYQPAYVEKATRVYNYNECVRSPTWRYCIGTDWNEKHGTEIVVLGYNTLTRRFQIVETLLVPRSEFTQLSGVQKLIEVNKKWRPSFVYIDSGGGATNAEVLMQTAQREQHRGGDPVTANLIRILKKYDSGSSIETKDLVTHQKVRNPAKPFMVNASVRMFEQQVISISAADSVLLDQLGNYIIERYTPNGTPVYGQEDESVGDHRLDALNLAIVAFFLEFDDLYRTELVTNVGYAPDPRRREQLIEAHTDTEQFTQSMSLPEDRRLESCIAPGVGRFDSRSVKTNRPGWDTDQEEERHAEYLQRKRSRDKVRRGRPQRTNI